jgi:hypothetical protein
MAGSSLHNGTLASFILRDPGPLVILTLLFLVALHVAQLLSSVALELKVSGEKENEQNAYLHI